MRKKAVNKNNVQEILLLAVLVAVAIAMLYNFTKSSKGKLKVLVEDSVMHELEACSAQIAGETDRVAGVVTAAGQVMLNASLAEEDIREAVGVIPDSCEAYLAVYCKTDGMAVTSSGQSLPLNETSYFSQLQGEEPFFLYVKEDGITETAALAYVLPVILEEDPEGYLMAFLAREFAEEAIDKIQFDTRAFFGIMEQTGRLLMSYGNTEGTDFIDENFWAHLRPYMASKSDWMLLEKRMYAGLSGRMYVVSDSEQRLIGVSILRDTPWVLMMGLEADYLTEQEEKVWDDNGYTQVWISLILVGILVVILYYNFVNRHRSAERSRELESKADTDLLTGLYNKIASERKITEYMEEHPEGRAMMVIVDLDNFKKINDTLGHSFGDEVLRSLGQQLKMMFRTTDILGRLGGDEFILLLKDVKDEESIVREGKKLEDFFRQFEVGEYVKYSVTASMGAAVFPRDATGFEGMYRAVDSALYIAKRRGKNQLAFYEKGETKKD